jgi:hypothetical protein
MLALDMPVESANKKCLIHLVYPENYLHNLEKYLTHIVFHYVAVASFSYA